MTHWSRHDPVMLPHGNVDHWTKMKVKATTFDVSRDANGTVRYLRPKDNTVDLREVRRRHRAEDRPTERYMRLMTPYMSSGSAGPHCTRSSGGGFDGVINSQMGGDVPGNYHLTRPQSSPKPRVSMNNIYHDKAKGGFKYWYQERPKPTSFGKYGIGSYKTVLGIGNAPRT